MVHDTGQWYLIARHGDKVMRVRPRLLLGETEAGELSFEASRAQLELDIDDDGGLVLSALGGHELEWAGGTRCHREHLARHRGAEIRLPHNVLILDTHFVEDIPAPPLIEDTTEPQAMPPGVVIAERPPSASEPDEQIVAEEGPANPRIQRTDERPWRFPSMAALVGLAAIGLGLLYFGFREDGVPEPVTAVGTDPAPESATQVPQSATAQAPPSDVTSHENGADLSPPAAPLPPEPLPLSAQDAPPATEQNAPEEAVTLREVSIPEPAAAPARERVAPPIPAERRSAPQVAKTTVADEAMVASKALATAPGGNPVKSRQAKGAATPTQATVLARRRALFAADQALAQGRLTTPPDANAYALYNRVLALDPESQEARSGLKSVREKLINRALAELAGNALDDARKSLQTAAEVGADPLLVANLRDEVDYRQQLINTRKDNE
jgi:hypothetical protein